MDSHARKSSTIREALPRFRQIRNMARSIREGASFRSMFASLQCNVERYHLGIELDVMPAKLYESLRKAFPGCEIVDVSPMISEQRAVKDKQELMVIQAAAELYGVAYHAMANEIRIGPLKSTSQLPSIVRFADWARTTGFFNGVGTHPYLSTDSPYQAVICTTSQATL